MNYSEALSFTFQDKQWLKKIGVGGLMSILSFYCGLIFIFGFFLIGYYIGILRNVVRGVEEPLPEWSDMARIFIDGLLGGIITLFYFIIIGGFCALAIVNIANGYMPDYEVALWIVITSLLTLFSLTVFINYGLLQYALTDNFGAAFSLSGIFNMIRSHLGDFLAISVFSLILNAMLFLAGLALLSPFTNFWGMVIQAHLFGQCARQMNVGSPAVQSA